MKASNETKTRDTAQSKAWKSPKIQEIGDIHQIVKGGGGKLSIQGGDPGENRKESGTG